MSGSVAVAERKLDRLIQKVEAGESEGIVTPYLDRFGRDIISGSVALKRIADVGGRLVCVNDGFDSTSPGSKEIFGYRMVTAEAFLDRVRANYQVAIDRKVAAGSYVYKAPFGYRKDEAAQAAAFCRTNPGAPIQAQVRLALSWFRRAAVSVTT